MTKSIIQLKDKLIGLIICVGDALELYMLGMPPDDRTEYVPPLGSKDNPMYIRTAGSGPLPMMATTKPEQLAVLKS